MTDRDYDDLAESLRQALESFGFEDIPEDIRGSLSYVKAWKRKTLNSNIAVALVSFDANGIRTGEYAKSLKRVLGKGIGYKFIIYKLCLQVVILGDDSSVDVKDLEKSLDIQGSPSVILQSIHVIDMKNKSVISAAVSDRKFTGKIQDSIQEAVKEFLTKRMEKSDAIRG